MYTGLECKFVTIKKDLPPKTGDKFLYLFVFVEYVTSQAGLKDCSHVLALTFLMPSLILCLIINVKHIHTKMHDRP